MSEANIKTIVKVTISNDPGCDDCGDDWDIEGFGNNLVEAINDAFESDEYRVTQLNIYSAYATLVDMVEVDGRKFFERGDREYTKDDVEKFGFLDIPESNQNHHTKLARKLLKSSLILKKYNDEIKAAKLLEDKNNKKIIEEKERTELSRLMQKYEIKGVALPK
ncbi:MAG: hypothetical protein M0R17_00955 [Candidatus Omnitrophica bacterium]|jgi:hypothetical protein|nr:hypothetical protein [Candidatus Omnitrophota bacterium]